jgi:hypothetical protein
MELAMLKALRDNPHYRLSEAQKRRLAELEGEIIIFGELPVHDVSVQRHQTIRRKRYGKTNTDSNA